MIAEADEQLLRDLLDWSEENDPDGEKFSRAPFEQMLRRNRPLTEPQRAWARSLMEQHAGGAVHYQNLASTGRLVRGREVPTPAVLQNLPKKPPGRR